MHTKVICSCLLLILIGPLNTKATHISGSDVTYRWLSGNSYEVTVTLYRDCSGIPADANVILNYRSASCGYNLNATLNPLAGTGTEITHPCSTAVTTCAGGTNAGIQQYVYRATITLPAQCTDWVFSYNVCRRNCAINTLTHSPSNCNGMPCLYVEATLNNVAAPTNSAPTFSNIPVAFVCIGQAFNYNHGAIDANGDSLVYSLVTPRDNSTTNVVYSSGHSATQPLLSSPPMTLNPITGDISMTPTTVEVTVMAVLVREYRNGVLIGSIIRDIEIWTQPCSNILPTATGINGTSNFNLVVCAGTPINFTINSHDNNAGQIVSMSWNFGITGATFTTTGSPYPTGTFSWTPTISNARSQPYTFTITVRDNNCPSNGFQIYSFSILVEKVITTITSTNSLCSGVGTGTAAVVASGGVPAYTYVWSPGGATTSSISGLVSGSYSVTATDSKGCTSTSTATITSLPSLVTSINSSSNISCFSGTNGSATASVSGGTSPYTYSWSPSGGTAAVASGLAAGTYSVTIRDANNCPNNSTVTISQPAILTASIPVHTDASCFGLNNASANVSVTGGTGPYDYSWSPTGGISSIANGLSAGNYSVLITDAHGCTTNASVTILQPPTLNLSTTTVPATCGATNGSASLAASGGTGPYTYSWSPGGATSTFLSGIPAGAYSVTVRDANNCVVSASAAVSNVGGPAAAIVSNSPVACYGGNNGSVSVSASGGTPPFSYTWFPTGGNAASATGLLAGNYTVTIRDGNNCSTSVSAVIAQPSLIQLNPSATDLSCMGSANGNATVVATGGTGPYSYLWSPGGSTSSSINGIAAGIYSVAVTDLHGCSQSTSAIVSQPQALLASISGFTNVSCFGNNNGSAIVNASGGTYPYTYSWSPSGGAAAAAAGLAAGNYSVLVTDANNCTRITNITISQPADLTATPTAMNVSCSAGTGSASVVATGGTSPYSYSWLPIGGTGTIASGLPAGNYSITVTDAHNCIQTSPVSITQPSALAANLLQSTSVSCFGGNNGLASVSATGGTSPYSYQWLPTGGMNSVASGLAAGNYTVTVTDAHNCTQLIPVVISQPDRLVASVPVSTNVTCNGGANGSATVSVIGGTAPYSYNWSGGNIPDTTTASSLTAGNYSVVIADALGCTSTATITIGQPSALVLSTTTTPATCGTANGSAATTISGGVGPYLFLWSPTGATSTSISGILAGAYSVTVTDANGCIVSTSAAISNLGGPTASISAISPILCNGGSNGSATVSVSGGTAPFSYSWFPSGGNAATATGLPAGNYTVTIRDGNFCFSSITANITQPSLLQLNLSATDASCFGSANGSASVAVSGGAGSYTYLWSPGGSTSQSLNGIVAGNYSVSVTDLNNCIQSSTVTISQPAALSASISTSTNVSCFGNNNGSATVNPAGGTAPFTFAWSPSGGTAATASGLSAGNYSIAVTDAHNCISNTTVVISEPAALAASPTATNVPCFGGNGSASVAVSGGTTPYSYAWSPTGGTAAVASGLSSGNYSINVTDAHNCSVTTSVSISQPAALGSSVPASNAVSCYGGNNGSATVVASGGTLPYSYAWSSSGGTGSVASGLTAGNYTVTVTDANNCSSTSSVSIAQPVLLTTAVPLSTNVSCHSGNNGSAAVTVSGGTSPYTYLWSPSGGTSASASGLVAGNYSVLITDAHNCTVTSGISITQPLELILSAATLSATCGIANGYASASISGGTGPFSFLWSPTGATSASLTGIAAGAYALTVTDALGCSVSTSAAVSNLGGPTGSISSLNPVACFGGNNGSASASVSGGSAPFSYGWFPTGGSGPAASGLAAGTYVVTIRDANNCLTSIPVAINQPAALSVNTSTTSVRCYGDNNGSASATVNGGTGPYSYSWNSGTSTSTTFSGLVAGTYSLIVTDFHGCIQNTSVNVTQPAALSAPISSSTNVSCFGNANGSATVSPTGGTAPYTFSWSPSALVAATAAGLTAGNYTVTVTDANNCMQNSGVMISEPSVLVIVPTATGASCFGETGSASAHASGGTFPYSYSWSPTGGNDSMATGLSAGPYTITITDANKCLLSASVFVSQPDDLEASILISSLVSCFGGNNGSATVVATGGTSPFTYQWFPLGGTNDSATGLVAGIYTIAVTDAHNCTQSTSVLISQPALLIATVPASTSVSCFGGNNGSASAFVTGGTAPYAYLWSPSGGTASTASGLVAGNHAITITDAVGCNASDTTTINQPGLIVLAKDSSAVSCYGFSNGSATANVLSGGTAPFFYNWSPLGGNSATANNLPAGNYTVTVNDGNGCEQTTEIMVSQPTQVALTPHSTDALCFGSSDGSAAILATGGTPPYAYLWSPGGNSTDSISNLAAGIDSVLVTDNNGCISIAGITVNQPAPLSITPIGSVTICIGQTTTISVNVTGGTGPFTYQWNNGDTNSSQNVFPVTTTSYQVDVHDAHGCTAAQQNLTVNVNPPLDVVASNNQSFCSGTTSTISALASGGNGGPYTYSWNMGMIQGSSISISLVHDSTFTVVVTDGCGTPSAMDTVIVTVNPLPTALFLPHLIRGCTPVNATFTDYSTTAPGSTYLWDLGDHTTSGDPNLSHVYTVPGHYDVSLLVQTPDGCHAYLTIPNAVTVDGFPKADFDQSADVVTFLNSTVNFIDKSIDAVNWEWNFGDASATSVERNPVHEYADTGAYKIRLVVNSAGGCPDTTFGLLRVEDHFAIYIPNSFTPNGDGINDGFIAIGVGFSEYNMWILDRWGKQIFHSTSKTQAWDGTYYGNHTLCQNDVYEYVIKVQDNHGKAHDFIGHVTLYR